MGKLSKERGKMEMKFWMLSFFHFVLPVEMTIIRFTLKLVHYVMSCNVFW